MALFGPAVLRVTVGVVFAAHGAQKLFGLWGGGGGLTDTAAFFAQPGLTPAAETQTFGRARMRAGQV